MKEVFRVGLIRLTDAAPLIVAQEFGYFGAENLEVSLSIEPSWANIADKLVYGLLDGAMLLPPLALALGLGVSGASGPEAILVPAALSLNGNTVTLANRWAAPVLGGDAAISAAETARRFHAVIRERGQKPVLAVVHTFSTHNLLLRYWLAAGGIDPDRDVALVVVPPAQTPDALAAGAVDRFCAGAPWGEVAARAGIGRTVATSHAIWNNGLEKVFAVRRQVADGQPGRLLAALRGLLRAAGYCDDAANAPAIAETLAHHRYLGLPAEVILTSLSGAAARRAAGAGGEADVSVFFANAAISRGARMRCGFSARCGAGAMSGQMSIARPRQFFVPISLPRRPARSGFRCRNRGTRTRGAMQRAGSCLRPPHRSPWGRIFSWTAPASPWRIPRRTELKELPKYCAAHKAAAYAAKPSIHQSSSLLPISCSSLIFGWHGDCCYSSCSQESRLSQRDGRRDAPTAGCLAAGG